MQPRQGDHSDIPMEFQIFDNDSTQYPPKQNIEIFE